MSEITDIKARINNSARKFLEDKGLVIIHEEYCCFAGKCDFVCKDEGENVTRFVNMKWSIGDGMPAETEVTKKLRANLEKLASCYMKEHEIDNGRVTFDEICLEVVASTQLFIKYHTDVLSNNTDRYENGQLDGYEKALNDVFSRLQEMAAKDISNDYARAVKEALGYIEDLRCFGCIGL